jgi:hypothetical protein
VQPRKDAFFSCQKIRIQKGRKRYGAADKLCSAGTIDIYDVVGESFSTDLRMPLEANARSVEKNISLHIARIT